MQVRCLITDKYDNTLYSQAVTVTIIPYAEGELQITSQPNNFTRCTSSWETSYPKAVSFTVGLSGTAVSYQWYYRKADSTSWTVWEGQTSATASCPEQRYDYTWDGTEVYCLIKAPDGDTLYTQPVTYTIIRDN